VGVGGASIVVVGPDIGEAGTSVVVTQPGHPLIDSGPDVVMVPSANEGVQNETSVCFWYAAPGCDRALVQKCVAFDYDAIARTYCTCRGVTVIGANGGLSEPWLYEGSCRDSDALEAEPDGGCDLGSFRGYPNPGCGAQAIPECFFQSADEAGADAGAVQRCTCTGETTSSIGPSRQPWAYLGACQDGETDAKPDVPDASTDAPPEQIVVGDSGWQWNVACPGSVADLCLDGGQPGSPICVAEWAQASQPSTWCALGASHVAPEAYCNGYYVVSVYGADPQDRSAGIYYFYDVNTGALVHVDSNAIPSFTKCVAGESGSRFDTFGCNYGWVDCP
jgi:hypothetical protein